MRAAATPATVATGTSGAASRLATTPMRLTEPCSRTITGAVIAWAATGIARAGPRPPRRTGSRAPIASPHGRVNSSSPRVASEESTNPKERASQGSTRSTTTIAAPSTGGPAARRDRLSPSSPMAPIAAARTTLGSGRASTTNPARAARASTGRQASRHADEHAEPQGEPGDDGDVAAADRREVGHAGGPHGLGEVGRCAAGVADDQARQQPPRVGRCVVDRLAQAGAKPLGRRGEGAWRRQDHRRPAHRQRRDPVVGPLGGPEPAVHPHRGAPRGVGDRRVTGEQHRGGGAAPQPAGVEHVDGRLAQHHRPVAAGREHDGVAREHRDGRDRRAVASERLDPAARPQDAVPRRRDLEHGHQRHGEHQRPQHAGTGAARGELVRH